MQLDILRTNSKISIANLAMVSSLSSAIQYLLRDFRRWLIDEQMKQRLIGSERARTQTVNPKTISWIEKLLQTPIDDYRKFVVWRILSPYLINIRRLAGGETNETISGWLDKCNSLQSLGLIPITSSDLILVK